MEPFHSPTTPTPPDNSAPPVRHFDIALVHASVTYNRYGWHDPHAAFFVLQKDLERHGGLDSFVQKAESGEICVEPLVIRANSGESIELSLTTHPPFSVHTITKQISAYSEPCTIFFDDNLFYPLEPPHTFFPERPRTFFPECPRAFSPDCPRTSCPECPRAFGALLIEEAGTTFHDQYTGEPLPSGTQAVIHRADGTCFREFTLFVHDTALHPDPNNLAPDNPDAPFPGINYRSEPASERLSRCEDPAYLFSSLVHEDPPTPLLETHAGDPLLLRLITIGPRRAPRHPFHATGMNWRPTSFEWIAPCASCQTFTLNQPYEAGDHLYTIGGHSCVTMGLWGILRVCGRNDKRLKPIQNGVHPTLPSISNIPNVPGENDVVRKYEIAVIEKKAIPRKDCLSHQPPRYFVWMSDAKREMKRRRAPAPLVLSADAGDWIEVTLHNCLNARTTADVPASSRRVSLVAQFLCCDPVYNSGLNIGRNKWEQTVAPGEKKKYLWRADQEYGCCLIRSFDSICCPQSDHLLATITIDPAVSLEYKIPAHTNPGG